MYMTACTAAHSSAAGWLVCIATGHAAAPVRAAWPQQTLAVAYIFTFAATDTEQSLGVWHVTGDRGDALQWQTWVTKPSRRGASI